MIHDIPLHFLAAGEQARVVQVTGELEAVQRLMEMGLGPGTLVEMVTPGSPCILRLNGHKLCFRADDLLSILVQRGSAE